ncbi:hypothetical protein PpBr36_01348 [Pyricularia pennisetigena]|uniref:hypothetical protein n=1 Tax=Pyricularia pennisetigena TaxID=1578925 RepID=UPI001152640C|nr:hypothetical protein PpBr36_01348 [Pyricularia pennisetigena]TLS29540.1 hypothetical protein PpBr36_01348 [Pyricularia pennisetigena]
MAVSTAGAEDFMGNGNGTEGSRKSSDSTTRSDFVPLVAVVDFHHARGPEVERWFGAPEGFDPAVEYDWSLLPFMALSDGAHASTEEFSYFTLLRPATEASPATSLFGIACTRQMDSSQLINRPADVTRSTVQKAVVVIAAHPRSFGMLRERMSIVTKAWFDQREFTDVDILRRFQESLAEDKSRGRPASEDEDKDTYLGLSLRELVREFKWQTLVLFKCCLLQPKMLFFGSRCERLCMMQFSLISLIPGLLRHLQDSASPELHSYEDRLSKPTGVKTSDRTSLLAYMGMPLQIFGKGSLFGPYTPLQQLDILADHGTKSYIVGSTNSILLQQKDRYSDILIDLDHNSVSITSPSLKSALALSSADRRWIESVAAEVNDTWDEANPGRPKTMGYRGSEESIRLQFEDYMLSLMAAVKCRNWQAKHKDNPRMQLSHVEGDPSVDFNPDWIEHWMRTDNYRIWNTYTDDCLFDIAEPKHPCASGLSRLAQQVQDLGLDERFAAAGVVVGRGVAAGKERASTILNKLYSDVEALREAQRKRAEQQQQQAKDNGNATARNSQDLSGIARAIDLGKAAQPAQTVSARAGAYASSWASWAGEKRKAWARSSSNTAASPPAATTPTTATGGWSFVGRRSSKRDTTSSLASSRLSYSDANSETEFNLRSPTASVASSGVHVDAQPTPPSDVSIPTSPAAEKRSMFSPEVDGSSSGNLKGLDDGATPVPSTAVTPTTEAPKEGVLPQPPAATSVPISTAQAVPDKAGEEEESKTSTVFANMETENVWANDTPPSLPIIMRKPSPEPEAPAPVGSKIVLLP